MRHSTILRYLIGTSLLLSFVLVGSHVALADDDEDLAAMQRALNKEIMERPFDPGDQAEVDQFVEDALSKNKIPSEYTGKDWKRGYTCNNLKYSLSRFRNCRHYYRHYGRYYPY